MLVVSTYVWLLRFHGSGQLALLLVITPLLKRSELNWIYPRLEATTFHFLDVQLPKFPWPWALPLMNPNTNYFQLHNRKYQYSSILCWCSDLVCARLLYNSLVSIYSELTCMRDPRTDVVLSRLHFDA